MAIHIPNYLVNESEIISGNNSHIVVCLKCSDCNSKLFSVYINTDKSQAEKFAQDWFLKFENYKKANKWKRYVSYIDEDGKKYFVKLNLFGKKVDKYYIGDMPKYTHVSIIKANCSECGKETIIFDNRIHGYDAFMTEQKKENLYEGINYSQRRFKGSKSNLVEVHIKIFNDSILEDFIEHTGKQASVAEYSNAFSDITIYGIVKDLNNKKIIIFSEETA